MKGYLSFALLLFLVSSCRTVQVATSDTQIETSRTEHVVVDSVERKNAEIREITDSVAVTTTIERTTVITVDLDGNEINRETNCNTTTNRDHFRDTKKKVEDKQEVRHNENLKKNSTLIKNHSEEKVIIQEPNFFQKLKTKIADIVLWLLAALVISLIIYKHYKQWQEKRKKQ
jgi:hypothetical protein